jgi:hypothetical protein
MSDTTPERKKRPEGMFKIDLILQLCRAARGACIYDRACLFQGCWAVRTSELEGTRTHVTSTSRPSLAFASIKRLLLLCILNAQSFPLHPYKSWWGQVSISCAQSTDLIQAPKIQANPHKAATILAWFHKTAQAHSIKDLEKTLPQVGAISNMHVKDYLQALADENKIRVEKIGSGNWYWSFPSDEKKAKDAALGKAQDEFNKINATAAELQAKVDEAGAARTDGEDMLMDTGEDQILLHGAVTNIIKVATGRL